MGMLYMIKRNTLMYLRDKGAVLFSFLAMFIVIALMLVFLGEINIKDTTEIFSNNGIIVSNEDIEKLVGVWTVSGILMINSLMVALTVIGTMVSDKSGKKYGSFLITPMGSKKIIFSYIASAWIISMLMCVFTLVISEAVLGYWLNVSEHIILFILIAVNTFFYSSLLCFAAVFINSSSAWSGMGTVVGTLSGFLGAIYLPMGALPDSVESFLKFTPLLHSSSLFRKVCTERLINNIFAELSPAASEEYMESMGITISIGETSISSYWQFAFIAVCGIILFILSLIFAEREIRKN